MYHVIWNLPAGPSINPVGKALPSNVVVKPRSPFSPFSPFVDWFQEQNYVLEQRNIQHPTKHPYKKYTNKQTKKKRTNEPIQMESIKRIKEEEKDKDKNINQFFQ